MGRFQFLRNGIDKVSDVLCGRFSSLEEILKRFISTARFDIEGFVGSNFFDTWDSESFKKKADFILAQMLMACWAKSILRFRHPYEVFRDKRDSYGRVVRPDALENYQKSALRVFSAMRYEIDKTLENSSYTPGFTYVFRNVLDEIVNIGGEGRELKLLGFRMMDEYPSVRQKMMAGLNHEEMMKFYSDYDAKINAKVYGSFLVELYPRKNPEWQIGHVYSKWLGLLYKVYEYYEIAMTSVRVTEISKDFL